MASQSAKKKKAKRPAAKPDKKPAKKTAAKPAKKSPQKSAKKSGKKRGRKKGLLITFVVLMVIIALGIAYVLTNLGFLIKFAIEKYGSQATQTTVRVSGVHISLKEGSCSMEDLTVGNPKGFDYKYAFSLGEIGADIDVKSLTGDEMGIEDIRVRAPEIFVEVNKDRKNNINEIKNNLPKSGDVPAKSEKSKKKGKEKKMFIRRILFDQGQIYARVVPLGDKEYKLRMPSIVMRNLRGTPEQITVQVINRLSKVALAEVKKSGVGQAVDKYSDEAKSRLDTEKNKTTDKLKKGVKL
jgi:hypothetical protein